MEPWLMAGVISLTLAVVVFTAYIYWEWRRDAKRREIEPINGTRREYRGELELAKRDRNDALVQDRKGGPKHGWLSRLPLRHKHWGVQGNAEGRVTSQPLGTVIQEDERASCKSGENVKGLEREVESAGAGKNERAPGSCAERVEEGYMSNNPRSSSSLPRLLITIPKMTRLSRFPTMLGLSSNSNPSPASARQHHRSSSRTDRISQPPQSQGSQSMSAHERWTSQATLQRYATVGTNDGAESSQPHTMQTDTDSVYTLSTLPSYPNTAKSPRPPPYLYLARSRSEHTIRPHATPTSGEGSTQSVPDIQQTEERREGI